MAGAGVIVSLAEAAALAEQYRAGGRRVVLTNGHFDVLHVGHAACLAAARALGDVLFVGVNSDASTVALKGPKRPIVPAADRALLLAHLRSVDHVVIFEETTAIALLRAVRPHVYAKGGDYAAGSLPEAVAAAEVGAEVRLLPLADGRSTSGIIERIVARYCP